MSKNSSPNHHNFSQSVLAWFEQSGRKNLPWQQNRTPYRVWISEIMLQQTQVTTVIPYFEKFMDSFPDVQSLASAEEDLVLHHWTGLGYYARARNLHKTAKIVSNVFSNIFPSSVDELELLPGIGRSTAGAIISLASNDRAVILDGNVKRVLCRYHCVEGWPDQTQTRKQLWQIAEQYTPKNNCRSYSQAMMDLGATICTRSKPLCSECPLKNNCEAHLSQCTEEFPHKKPKTVKPVKHTQMLLLQSTKGDKVLLEKRPSQGIWGGLWSFPEIESGESINDFLNKNGFSARKDKTDWDEVKHTFSHFHLWIKPQVLKFSKEPSAIMESSKWHWYDLKQPSELGLAAPVKALLKKLS